jgi:AcrR family transcriptional regulator
LTERAVRRKRIGKHRDNRSQRKNHQRGDTAFFTKGFDAASVNEIAEQANVTKALIYYYFKSKREILDYLVHSLMDNITSLGYGLYPCNIVQMIAEGGWTSSR